MYGFFTECLKKFGVPTVWQYITEMFDYLPIAAVVENRLFCIHGGLSPLIQNLDDINLIERFGDIPTEVTNILRFYKILSYVIGTFC